MPFKTAPKQIKSWSNSRYNDWLECPAKAKYKHLDKLPEPKGPAMERGIFIAEQEEAYFLGKARNVPPDIHKDLVPEFKRLKAIKTKFVEESWGFDVNWNPVDYFDWNNCVLRVKVDIGYTEKSSTIIHLYDNKTGGRDKRTGGLKMGDVEKYDLQLDLYRAAAVARYPTAQEFHTKLLFTDLGVTWPLNGPLVSTRAQALASQKKWNMRIKPMMADKRFPPKPGYYCSWCHYRKSNGGPCKF